MSSIKLKDSGIAWIGKIPQHWEVGKVKHYYKMHVGFTPTSSNSLYYDEENGHTWITISDMKSKVVSESSSKISALYIQEKNPKIVPKNSLLYSFKLSVGVVAFNEKEVYTNEAIASFLDGENVNLSFLYYSSRLIAFNANENIYGAKLLNQELIKNAKIVFPPLHEQEAIAKFLDEKCQDIDALIATHQESIEKLRDYRTSLISETITQGLDKNATLKDSGIAWIGKIPQHWEVKKLKFVATLNPIFKHKNQLRESDEVSFLPMECLRTNKINPYIASLGKVSDYTFFQENDILMAKVTPCFENLNIAKATNLRNGIGFGTSEIYILRCFDIFDDFLLFFIQSDGFVQKATSEMRGANGLKRIPSEFVSDCKIPLPPLHEQEAIAKFLDEKCQDIDALIATHQESIEKLRGYRTSLISEVIVGQHQGAYQ